MLITNALLFQVYHDNALSVTSVLCQVVVKSMSDFKKSCFAIIKSPLQKMANEPPQRSHRGMIINVVTSMKNASLLGRMNLVDLAGLLLKFNLVKIPLATCILV